MAQGLERIIQHKEFQAMPYENQVALMSNILGQVSPDLAEDEEGLTSASQKAIRKFRPRSPFERSGSFLSGFIPIAGPLIQQYGFDEDVPPPGLLTALGVTDDDNPYGGLIRAGLDVPLMIGGGIVGGLAVGAVGSISAGWGAALMARNVPAFIGRELISGAASGTGELVLDPPHSVPEAGARLGLSAIGQAVFTGVGKTLFGADARTNRKLKSELGTEGFAALNDKLEKGNYQAITDEEIAASERAFGSRKDQDAVNARQGMAEMKLRRQAYNDDLLAAENLEALNRQRAETVTGAEDEYKRFQREQTTEKVVSETQIEQEALQKTYFETMIKEGEQVQEERIVQRAEPFLAERERVEEIDSLINQIEKGPVQRGGTKFLQSEDQMVELLNDVKINGPRTGDLLSEGEIKQAAQSLDLPEGEVRLASKLSYEEIEQRLTNAINEHQNAVNSGRSVGQIADAGLDARVGLYKNLEMRKARQTEDTFPFVKGEPTTLPVGMIQDLGGGQNRAVIVERISGNRADLRYLGPVDRRLLRLPKSADELAGVRRIEGEQGVKRYPDFEEAKEILNSRIEGERLTRLASLEAERFNSTDGTVQREIFRLRRDASLKFLDSHNGEVSLEVREQIRKIKSIDDKRTLASVERLSAVDAEATTKALRSAGFEQVRTALRPEGTFDVSFGNQDSPEVARLGGLHSRYITYQGTIDPTSERTYSGLTPAEHDRLGTAFGIEKDRRDRFNDFIETYAKELRDRGIRFPVTTEALGVESIEDQVAKGAKRVQRMRSEVIANSEENVRRIDSGDVIEYQGQKGITQLLITDKKQTFDPEGNGLGTTTYQVTPVSQLGFSGGAGVTFPLTEGQFKQMGVKRSVAFPISPEQQPKFSIDSPSRNIGDLFGLTREQMPVPTVEGNPKAIREAAGELGLKASVTNDGIVRLSGKRVDLSELTPEDASLILSRLKQFQQDRTSLLNFFEGCL